MITINQYEQYIQAQNWDSQFRYMLLDRMRCDCDYFLDYGLRNEKNLWAKTVTDQIGYMRALWDSFPEDGKPEWLTMKQISDYERNMRCPRFPGIERSSHRKVIVGRPVNGITLNGELEFILDDDGDVRYFDYEAQARETLRQDGVQERDMGFFTFLHSCGTCFRCGAPLFPSLIEGYTYQCFTCDEDFYTFEQGMPPVQDPIT